MRFVRSVVLAAAASSCLACGGGQNAGLQIEIAATPDPGAAAGDQQCLSGTPAMLPPEVDCVSVTVCRREGETCREIPVLRPSDSRDERTTELRIEREGTGGDISFDVALESGGEYELELRAYAGGVPYARGRATDVRAGQGTIRVRLEPYGRWACAPQRADGAPLFARALHAAVAVPNGDVLLIGGVTGEAVQALSVEGGALLQRTIEVYDASEGRFYNVPVTDHDGTPGFGAVFHQAFYLDTLADGRYRVRVIGGFTAEDQPAARFDAIQGFTQYGSPLLPGARASRRDSVDILYDPRTRAITVELVDPGAVQRAGMNGVSEPNASGEVVVALGALDGGGTAPRPVPMLAAQWYELERSVVPGTVTPMPMVARLGHTASRLSESTVLVWGGNVTQTTVEDVAARAGELLGGASAGEVASGVADLPPSTAFHTATLVTGGVLVAGGMEIAPVAAMSGGVSSTPSSQPLTVIVPDPTTRVRGVVVPVDGAAWPTPALHGAAALPSGQVLVTGGALRRMVDEVSSHLWASDATLLVGREPDGSYSSRVLPRLIGARWGHAVTPLSDGRVLVTGGFVREGGTLRAIASAETLIVEAPPPVIASCTSQIGAEDPSVFDAGLLDAGVAPSDAGAADDASIDGDAAVDDAGADDGDAAIFDDAGL